MAKMRKTSELLCSTCVYGTKSRSCNYLLITGERRDCPVGVCDKYKKADIAVRINQSKKIFSSGVHY